MTLRYPYRPNPPALVDTEKDAIRMRETFMDRGAQGEKRMAFTWPDRLQLIGQCMAVEYRSDKWHEGDFEDYKHLAESLHKHPQPFLACKDFLADWPGRRAWPVHGPMVGIEGPMPRHFAELTELLGVQLRLHVRGGDRPAYGRGNEGIVQVRVTRGMLGGARDPKTKKAFLLIYTPRKEDGLHAIITGARLDVKADGIVG